MRGPFKHMIDVVEQSRRIPGAPRGFVKQVDRRQLASQLAIPRSYGNSQFAWFNANPACETFTQSGAECPGCTVAFEPRQLDFYDVGQNLVPQSQGTPDRVSLIVARTAINRFLVARRKRPVILERVGACFPGSSALKANLVSLVIWPARMVIDVTIVRSEEHTSELQSLMRISYAVFC